MSTTIEAPRPRARKFVAPQQNAQTTVFDTVTPAKAPVSRVMPTDIDDRLSWDIALIQEDFGEPPLAVILRWMRTWSMDNQFNFAHTENAIGLAMLSNEPLTSDQIVQELFVYAKAGHRAEALDIYQHFHKWMKTSRAVRFRFNHSGGVGARELEQIFGPLKSERMWYVEAE